MNFKVFLFSLLVSTISLGFNPSSASGKFLEPATKKQALKQAPQKILKGSIKNQTEHSFFKTKMFNVLNQYGLSNNLKEAAMQGLDFADNQSNLDHLFGHSTLDTRTGGGMSYDAMSDFVNSAIATMKELGMVNNSIMNSAPDHGIKTFQPGNALGIDGYGVAAGSRDEDGVWHPTNIGFYVDERNQNKSGDNYKVNYDDEGNPESVVQDNDEDIDDDGTPNNKDDDMDGDGKMNNEDEDQDGDGVLDDEDSDPENKCDPKPCEEDDNKSNTITAESESGAMISVNSFKELIQEMMDRVKSRYEQYLDQGEDQAEEMAARLLNNYQMQFHGIILQGIQNNTNFRSNLNQYKSGKMTLKQFTQQLSNQINQHTQTQTRIRFRP